jgi:hypothetical protein
MAHQCFLEVSQQYVFWAVKCKPLPWRIRDNILYESCPLNCLVWVAIQGAKSPATTLIALQVSGMCRPPLQDKTVVLEDRRKEIDHVLIGWPWKGLKQIDEDKIFLAMPFCVPKINVFHFIVCCSCIAKMCNLLIRLLLGRAYL